jgi:hypothetical protein
MRFLRTVGRGFRSAWNFCFGSDDDLKDAQSHRGDEHQNRPNPGHWMGA